MKRAISILCFLSIHHFCFGSERDVFLHIFDGYNNRIRPVFHTDTTTVVGIQLQIVSLLEVNAQQEYIRMSVFMKLNWTDEYLTWDPADFNGTEDIRAYWQQVWHPDVTIVSMSMNDEEIIPKEEQLVQINYLSEVDHTHPFVLTKNCPMDTDNYPFDTQTCDINAASYSYTSKFVYMQPVSINDSSYTRARNLNTEWIILPYTQEAVEFVRERMNENGAYRGVQFSVSLKRKPSYYIWVIIVPTFVISAISIAGIFAPFSSSGEREEKVTMGLTTLLTLAVILSLVTGEMPRATSLALLGRFILLELVICALSVFVSVLIAFLHERATTRLWKSPSWPLFCCETKKNFVGETSLKNCNQSSPPHQWVFLSSAVSQGVFNRNHSHQQLENTLHAVRCWLEKCDEEETLKTKWIIFFDRVDLACFVVFQLLNIFTLVITLCP